MFWVCTALRTDTLPINVAPKAALADTTPTTDTDASSSNKQHAPVANFDSSHDLLTDSIDLTAATSEGDDVKGLPSLNLSQHDTANTLMLNNGDTPVILTDSNKSHVYILAHVLDMKKGLYYIPTNVSANSTEGWVFWKIPRTFKLGNPTDKSVEDVLSTNNSTDDGSHQFFILMLGLGCFVCGLMVMLILTLVILTRRFSKRTRPPASSRCPVADRDTASFNKRRHADSQSLPPLSLCENVDYYQIPHVTPLNRMRRFSSDDALDILRHRALPSFPPHFCACQLCYYDDVALLNNHDVTETLPAFDDDVPLINPSESDGDAVYSHRQLQYRRYNDDNYVNSCYGNNHPVIELQPVKYDAEDDRRQRRQQRAGNIPLDTITSPSNDDASLISPQHTASPEQQQQRWRRRDSHRRSWCVYTEDDARHHDYDRAASVPRPAAAAAVWLQLERRSPRLTVCATDQHHHLERKAYFADDGRYLQATTARDDIDCLSCSIGDDDLRHKAHCVTDTCDNDTLVDIVPNSSCAADFAQDQTETTSLNGVDTSPNGVKAEVRRKYYST